MEENKEYFSFHKNENKTNKHYFLSEELLVPRANNCDTQRLNMFSNHINQMVHLKNPELPKLFSNFENQIGEYSIAYKRAEKSFKIIAKIVKNKFNYDLIVQYDDGVFDIIHERACVNITEDYGYALNDQLGEKNVGDIVEEGEFLYKSDNYGPNGEFMYGANLKAVYMPYKNLTYEDGVVISESAAKKLTSYKVEKTLITINGNDFLLNLYGDGKEYKGLPEIGEEIHSKILLALRRKDKRSALYDMQASKMKEVDPGNDDVIYTGGGKLVDVDIFSNTPLQELKKREGILNNQLLSILENNYRYWTEMATELEKIIPCKILSETEMNEERRDFGIITKHPISDKKNKNKFTEELAYYWKLSHEFINEKIDWRYDGKSFENFKVLLTILKENPLTPGCKLTARYGNKGVVTLIEKDENMPQTSSGIRADVCLNPLGVIGRLNPSQLQEQYINFMSDHVLAIMKKRRVIAEKAKILFSYLEKINIEEFNFFKSEYKKMSEEEKKAFIKETEENGIYIHQAPFFGNTSEEEFKAIFKEHPEWTSEYLFENIERPMVMGDVYFIRLKHEANNKTSIRSAANLNIRNLPSKSNMKKEKKILYSSTPIRLGEMEISNLMICKRGDLVGKLLKTYSTNENLREETIRELLCPGELKEHQLNNLNMNLNVDTENNHSVPRDILEQYFNLLSYSLFDNN